MLRIMQWMGLAHREYRYANIWWGWHRPSWKYDKRNSGHMVRKYRCRNCKLTKTVYREMM